VEELGVVVGVGEFVGVEVIVGVGVGNGIQLELISW